MRKQDKHLEETQEKIGEKDKKEMDHEKKIKTKKKRGQDENE